MRHRHHHAGITLIEMLITGLIMVLVGSGILALVRSSYESQYALMGQNTASASARGAVDSLVDGLRGATALTAATASSVTYTYTDSGGATRTIRYWKTGSEIRRTVNGSPVGGAVVANGVSAFLCSYWSWSGTAWSSSSTPSDLSRVGAVDVSVDAVFNGMTRQISGSTRIRQKRF